MIQIKIEFAS